MKKLIMVIGLLMLIGLVCRPAIILGDENHPHADPNHESASTIDLVDGEDWVWDIITGDADYVGIEDGYQDGYVEEDAYYSDAFDGGHELYANETGFEAGGEWDTEDDGREVVYGWQDFGDFDVQRKIYVPEEHGFARFLNLFCNTTGSPIEIDVVLATNLGSDGDGTYIDSNGRFNSEEGGAQWFFSGGDYSDPVVGHIFDGNGEVSGEANYSLFEEDPSVLWTLTIQPGETKAIVWFGTMRYSCQQTREAVNFIYANPAVVFAGMSTDEMNQVCNWEVGDEDEDGMADVWEDLFEVDAEVEGDADEDGVDDDVEYGLNTNPTDEDTDGDGMTDLEELNYGAAAPGLNGEVSNLDPLDPDTDNDGLSDGFEANELETDPLYCDTDEDLIPDGTEVANETDPLEFSDYSEVYDVFCAPWGDDEGGDGSQEDPYFSIDRAMDDHPDNMPQGPGEGSFDVFVGPGWYVLTQDNSFGELETPTTITGAGVGLTTLDGDDNEYNAFYVGYILGLEISHMSFFRTYQVFNGSGDMDGLFIHDIHGVLNDYYGIEINTNGYGGTYTLSDIVLENTYDAIEFYGYEENAPNFDEENPQQLFLLNITILGDQDYGIDAEGDGFENSVLVASNLVVDHQDEGIYVTDWGTVSFTNVLHEDDYYYVGFYDIMNLELVNFIHSGTSDDEGFDIGNIGSLSMRNCTSVNCADSGVNLYSIDEAVLHNNIFAFNDDYGLNHSLEMLDEDYNNFFNNAEGDINFATEPGTNSVSVDPLFNDAGWNGVYTPHEEDLQGAGDDNDEEEGTLDDNIGSNNGYDTACSGLVTPGDDDIIVRDDNPESETYGTGFEVDGSDVDEPGVLTIELLNEEESEALLNEAGAPTGFGIVFNITWTGTFEPGTIITLFLSYSEEDLDGNNPATLVLWHKNLATGQWRSYPVAEVDEENHLLIVNYPADDGFSPFVPGMDDNDSGPFGSSSSNCFIATASLANGYGTQVNDNVASYYLSQDRLNDLNTLRSFRDSVLMNNCFGRAFVGAYYKAGPVAARMIKDSEVAKFGVRTAIVSPLVVTSKLAMGKFGSFNGRDTVGFLMLGLYGVVMFYVTRRVVRRIKARKVAA